MTIAELETSTPTGTEPQRPPTATKTPTAESTATETSLVPAGQTAVPTETEGAGTPGVTGLPQQLPGTGAVGNAGNRGTWFGLLLLALATLALGLVIRGRRRTP